MRDIFRELLKHVPAHVLRLIAGSVMLGLMLMLVVAVSGQTFRLSETTRTWIGIGGALVFALYFCWSAKRRSEKFVQFVASAIIIFAVGLTSNNVIAEISSNLGLNDDIELADGGRATRGVTADASPAEPPPVPPLSEIPVD